MALETLVENVPLHFSNIVFRQSTRIGSIGLPEEVSVVFSYGDEKNNYSLKCEIKFERSERETTQGVSGFTSHKDVLKFGDGRKEDLMQIVHDSLETVDANVAYWMPDQYNAGSFRINGAINGEVKGHSTLTVNFNVSLEQLFEGRDTSQGASEFEDTLTGFVSRVTQFVNECYAMGNVDLSRTLTLKAPSVKQERHVVEHKLDSNTDATGIEQYIKVEPSPTEAITWDQVGGLDAEKKELILVAKSIRDGLYQIYGIKPKTGYMFVGTSGNGKTYLAKAFAANAGLAFYELTMSDLRKPIVGTAEAQIAAVHREAFKQPSMIFIDEFDGFAAFGDYDHTKAAPLATLRYWMSEASTRKSPVIYVATTTPNGFEKIDPQFLRPGRFTEHVYLKDPTVDEKAEILRVHVENVVGEANGEVRVFDNLDFMEIAGRLDHATRAQTSETVRGVVEAMVHYHSTNGQARSPVTTKDYMAFLEQGSLPNSNGLRVV